MKKTTCNILFLLIAALFILSAGCIKTQSVVKDVQKIQVVDFSLSTTVGNHTYLPFFSSSDNNQALATEIISVLDEFEKAHPDLEVISWNIDRTDSALYGIWINHRPKQAACVQPEPG